MSEVSRRHVAAGAAWAVPVIALGVAAPAMAASPAPTVATATATDGGVNLADLALTFAGVNGTTTYCITIDTITRVSGPAQGGWAWTGLPAQGCFTTGPLILEISTATNTLPGITWSAHYTITVQGSPTVLTDSTVQFVY